MPNARYGTSNPNFKGGICNIKHVDELLNNEPYLRNRKQKILDNHVVSSTGCWLWTAGIFKLSGRARISIGIKSTCAARVSYIAFNLEPIGELLVCHSCDNVLCVNPHHLWLGTCADNSKDMVNKNRTKDQKGSLNHAAKLSEDKVRKIRKHLSEGMKQYEVAKMFGVTKGLIGQIHRRLIWKHVK